eukprot:s232_g22.t1
MRIGEATVPGPDMSDVDSFLDPPHWTLPEVPVFCLGVANPSGISNKHHMLDSLPIGLWHFAETQASHVQQCHLRSYLKGISHRQERHIRAVMGAPAGLRARSATARSWTGVLCFGDCPLRDVPHAWPSSEHSSGRIMLSVAHLGSTVLSMATVYCPPKGPTFPRARALSEELLMPVTEALVLGRSGPRAILGDFNCPAGTLDQTKIWQSQGWIELQDLMHQLHGVAPQHTCKSATAPDQIWLSPEMALLVHNSAVWNIFPDHSVLMAGLRVPVCSRMQMQWRLPGHIPWDHVDSVRWLSAQDLGPIYGTGTSHEGSSAPVDSAEATVAFHSWCHKFEEAASLHCRPNTVRADKSFYGRGALDRPRPRLTCMTVPKHSRSGEVSQVSGFLNRAVSRWFKQLRRLQSYQHAINSNRAGDTFLSRASLWHSILAADGFQHGFKHWWIHRPHPHQGAPATLPEYPPNPQVSQLIYQDFLQHYRRFEHWQLSKRHESCKNKLLSTSKGVFAVTRKPAKDNLDCLEDTEEQLITVVDGNLGLVAVDHPFYEGSVIHWTLQDQPTIVSRVPETDTHYQISSDLLLVDGQKLACKTLVHEEDQIHQRLEALWSPRWRKHANTPISAWEDICQFAAGVLPKLDFCLPSLCVEDWKRAVRSYKPGAATGPCGLTRLDLLNMSDSQIHRLLEFFHDLEHGAPWPRQLQVGLVHLLQKRATSTKADGFRPITVMSMLYRVYAGLRAGQLLHQLASLAETLQCGFIKGRQAADVWYFVGVCVELSIQQNVAVHGLMADLVKAYNTLPRHPVFFFLKCVGVPGGFLDMWQRHLQGFVRYFVVRRSVSLPQSAQTGFPEGCPLSCVSMAIVDLVWHLFQTQRVPRSLPISFVDNLELLSDRVLDLVLSSSALESFCRLLDLELDQSCLVAWSTSAHGRHELRNHGFKISLGQRDLGGQVMYCKQLRNRVLQDRIEQVLPYFAKLRASAIPQAAKTVNIKLVLWPRALHGCESAVLGDQHIHKLRSGAMKALRWDRAGASPFVRLSLLHIELDPGWYQLWRVVKMFKTQVLANAVVADWWKQFINGSQVDTSHGPFGKLVSLMTDLDMTIDEHFFLGFSERGSISLLTSSDSVIRAVLQRAFQRQISRKVVMREGFAGLDGFDDDLTCSNDHVFSAAEVEQLMIVRDGSFFTDHTKSKWDATVSDLCPWCRTKDTKLHRYTECAKYDSIRAKYNALFAEWDQLPQCFQQCGLVPSNPWQELVWEALCQLPDRTSEFQFKPLSQTMHVFTDGTCSDPTCSATRLAAWATVVAGYGTLSCGPLVGIQQCILRAELTAVISVLCWIRDHSGSVHIWSDSQIVVDHFRALQSGASCPDDFEHSDLWGRVLELQKSTSCDVFIHKVFSHDVECESVSPLQDFCRVWNHHADQQAAISNLIRPAFFNRVWHGFCAYRSVWKRRVKLFTAFVVEVAAFDCSSSVEDNDEPYNDGFPCFDVSQNDGSFSVGLQSLEGRVDFFTEAHSFHFKAVFRRLIEWLSATDASSATMRPVSLLELYVGFRLSGDGRLPLVTGGCMVDRFSPVTFAVDYSFFKQLIDLVFQLTDCTISTSLTLTELNVFIPIPATVLGWPSPLAALVFEEIVKFVRGRPVTSTQSLSRPWTP